MTIPTLSTSDKSFICSYVIGSNVDHRLAIGVINEITTYTTEYIDGFCWIPVCAPDETNDESWYWDIPEKDVVYVKIGVRVSADGYIHTWLTSIQAISELILWNNNYNEHNSPVNDTTTLHWVIEKIYRQVIGNITGFNYSNIKFQCYGGGNNLYMFGNHTNHTSSSYSSVDYTTGTTVYNAGVSWYPTNSSVINGDYLYLYSDLWKCRYLPRVSNIDGWRYFQGQTPWGMPPDTMAPSFWLEDKTIHTTTHSVNKHCEPGVCDHVQVKLCNHEIVSITGNQSGRNYGAWAVTGGCYPEVFPCVPEDYGVPGFWGYAIDECENEAYIWVPGYCSGGSGSGPSECAENGGHWVPGHYECDPSFVYDDMVTIKYMSYTPISADQINYPAGAAHFSSIYDGEEIIALFAYNDSLIVIDEFDEIVGDLDELKPNDITSISSGAIKIVCRYVPHVGVALFTGGTTTIDYSDWVVMWGVNDYFSSWQTPDGLSARNPGTSQTLLDRPLTHHDRFYTGGTDVTGGFLYEPITSNAFLSRSIDAELKIDYLLCNRTNFCWLYVSDNTTDPFIWREIDAELKIDYPLCNNADFCWLYVPMKTYIYFDRTVGTETKIDFPISNNCDFSFLYRLREPIIAVLYHLKTTGDDSKDGRSWPNAWRHWSYMAQNMPYEGYTVLVMDGVYDTDETQIGPDNSTVVFLVDSVGEDNPAEVIVKL